MQNDNILKCRNDLLCNWYVDSVIADVNCQCMVMTSKPKLVLPFIDDYAVQLGFLKQGRHQGILLSHNCSSHSKEDEASSSDEVSSLTTMSSLRRSDPSTWPLPFDMISFVECVPCSFWEVGGILSVRESFSTGNPASWCMSTSN